MPIGTDGKLSGFASTTLMLSCMLCSRRAETVGEKLLARFGDLELTGVLLPFAASKGCTRARAQLAGAAPHGGICRIRVTIPETVGAVPPSLLGECWRQGWHLTIKCASHRAGMKSKRPCGGRYRVDVYSLMVAFGPVVYIDRLADRLHCPECGRRGVMMFWSLPGSTGSAVAAE